MLLLTIDFLYVSVLPQITCLAYFITSHSSSSRCELHSATLRSTSLSAFPGKQLRKLPKASSLSALPLVAIRRLFPRTRTPPCPGWRRLLFSLASALGRSPSRCPPAAGRDRDLLVPLWPIAVACSRTCEVLSSVWRCPLIASLDWDEMRRMDWSTIR
jgi:hypothetical protein